MDEEKVGSKPVKILATSAVDGTGMEVLRKDSQDHAKVVGMRTSVSQHRVRARTPVDVCIDSIIEQVLCYQLTCTYRLFC